MIPKHVAIIMDGNGRWAEKRGYPRFFGHVRGTKRVKEIVTEARQQGVRALTLYAFSTENWKRPDQELQVLWHLLRKYLRQELNVLDENQIRLNVVGDWKRLPSEAVVELEQAMLRLSHHQEMILTFALSYGARREWVEAVKGMIQDQVTAESVNEDLIEKYLETHTLGSLSNVDLMIRTSGEKRLSNFLLWQCAYAEFEFPEKLWPDFTREDFRASLDVFSKRERRYGGVQKS